MESLKRYSLKRVASIAKQFEKQFRSTRVAQTQLGEPEEPQFSCFQRSHKKCGNFLKSSRFAGIPLALVYGIFLYLYITYMILPEKGNISGTRDNRVSKSYSCFSKNASNPYEDTYASKYNISLVPIAGGMKSSETSADIKSIKGAEHYRQVIGFGVSSSFSLILGITSIFSHHTRCTLMLILPGMVAGRGRAVLMTLVMGFLIEGPINSINYNINQIVESSSCMYESMKSMACLYTVQIQKSMAFMVSMVKEQQRRMTEDLRNISEKAKHLTDAAKKELEQRKAELEKSLRKMRGDMKKLREFLEDINKPCQYAESALGSIGTFFDDAFDEIASWFSKKRRKRRSVNVCGTSTSFPDVNINPEMNLETLKELHNWAKDIAPDFDMEKLNIPDLKKLIKAPSVEEIRQKILRIVSNLFDKLREYLTILKKCFFLISLLLLTIDSVQYLQQYYSDDSFDNQFIDNNIRMLWRHQGFEKLTPLRHWELDAKYQVSASPKLSSQEIKRIFVNAFPTIVISVVALFMIFGDYALAELLDSLAANGKFALSFEGMEQGINLEKLFNRYQGKNNNTVNMERLKLEKIDLSTDPCLPKPMFSSTRKIGIIILMLVLMGLSCFFDAYAMRLRAKICNVFYKDRATERGEFLHKQISSGRHTRRFQLRMIVLKELRRRKKIREFSWLGRIPHLCYSKEQKNMHCPGCLWKVDVEETKEISIQDHEITMNCKLCSDCHKDV